MALNVTLCFAAGTGIELYFLSMVSRSIGILNTVSFCMFTFLIGWVLVLTIILGVWLLVS